MGPSIGVTEDRVIVLLNKGFTEYEKEVSGPRHRDNIAAAKDTNKALLALSNQWAKLEGALLFAKIMGSIIAFMCMAILGLLGYLASHHTQSLISHQEPTTVAQQQYSEMK
jgi:hypothetical protein